MPLAAALSRQCLQRTLASEAPRKWHPPPRSFFSNSPLHDSNFDIGGVRKAFAKAEEVYSLFEPLDAKPPYARLKLAPPDAPHDCPEPERKAAYEWLDGLLK